MGKPKITNLRWKICGFLMLGTAVNYMDRMTLNLTKTTIGTDLGITSTQFGVIFMYFSLAYAVMFTPVGRFIDLVGTKVGYAVCLIFWSVAGILHGFAGSASQFTVLRSLLGSAEGGSWTGGTRAAAEWFPPKERATAVGIWNGGSSIGGILACLLIPKLVKYFGWRVAFVVIGAVGLIWLIGWVRLYAKPAEHDSITDEERELILSTQAAERSPETEAGQANIRFIDLICFRQVWGILLYRLLTDQIWWFYVLWLPATLQEDRGLNLTWAAGLMIPLFILAVLGGVSGGWFSSFLQKRGWSTTLARKTVLTIGCLVMVSGLSVAHAPLWLAVTLVSAIACFYTFASGNILTIPADVAPRHLTATVMGMSGLLAGLGGMWMNLMTGHIKDTSGNYGAMMATQAIMPVAALLVIWLVMGEIKPIRKTREFRWTKPLFSLSVIGFVLLVASGLLPHITNSGLSIAARVLDPKLPKGVIPIAAQHPIAAGLRNGDFFDFGFAKAHFNIPLAFRISAIAFGLLGLWTLIGDAKKQTCRAQIVGLLGVFSLAFAAWHVLGVSLRLVSFEGTVAAFSQPGFYLLVASTVVVLVAFGLTVSQKPTKAELEGTAA